MKKKILITILSFMMAGIAAFSFAGCDSIGGNYDPDSSGDYEQGGNDNNNNGNDDNGSNDNNNNNGNGDDSSGDDSNGGGNGSGDGNGDSGSNDNNNNGNGDDSNGDGNGSGDEIENIYSMKVLGYESLDFELTDDSLPEQIKTDLLTRNLEVMGDRGWEYVQITEDMIHDFYTIDTNSYEKQSFSIEYKGYSLAVTFTKPYSLDGAKAICTLSGSSYFTVSSDVVDDLGMYKGDAVETIVLYNNGCAVLKNAGYIGDVTVGYKLAEDNQLILNRHGTNVGWLYVDFTNNSFDYIASYRNHGLEVTPEIEFAYSYTYFPESNSYLGYSYLISAYSNGCVFIHRTGWASSVNSEGYAYQIAGVGLLGGWHTELGFGNGEEIVVISFCDQDWTFRKTGKVEGDYYLLESVKNY